MEDTNSQQLRKELMVWNIHRGRLSRCLKDESRMPLSSILIRYTEGGGRRTEDGVQSTDVLNFHPT